MKLRGLFPFLALALIALGQGVSAQPANHWRAFKKSDGLPENACVSVTLGANGNVLVRHAKSSAISVLDGYGVTIVPGPGMSRGRIYESPGGQLWTVTAEGLQEFREGEWTLHRVPEIAEYFRSHILSPSDGARGLSPARPTSATGSSEISLLPVRQGRVLILLPDRLLQLNAEDPDRPQVELLRMADQTSLRSFTGMTRARDDGLWISGARGFAKIAGPLRTLKPDDEWTITTDTPPELNTPAAETFSPDEISVRKIFDVTVESRGVVWLATSDGLFRRAPQIWETERRSTDRLDSGMANRQRANPGTETPPAVPVEVSSRGPWKSFLGTRDGDLWLGGPNEIAWRRQGTWQFFTSTNQIGPENTVAFAESPDGRIRCATPNKLWEFDGKNWLVVRTGLDRINDLHCGRDGTLWVATENGLHRFTQGTWIANGTDDGLPSAVVNTISEDDAGRIFASTDRGASLFHPDADPDAPRTLLHTRDDEEQHYREGTPVTLSFSGWDKWKLTTADRLLFSYRLDEQEWSPFQESGEAFFHELPLGKHYFRVRAMDRAGNIDPNPARLEFAVVVPWYRETRLVIILSVALAVAVFFAALAANRHRKLSLSYAEVERKIAERTHELEVANRELLHSQKMNALGSLAAGIAHDFNNILSIVKGSAQIIEDNVGNPEKIHTRVDRIKTVVQQGAEVVEAMLGFSRSTDEPPAPCDLNAIVADTMKLLGDRFLREVEVRFERGGKLPEISVPRDFVQQILLNFIFNAAEAMERPTPDRPDSGDSDHQLADLEIDAPPLRKQINLTTQLATKLPADIFLTPTVAASYILIAVRDSGSGIAPQIKPRIFEPFFTTKSLSTKRGTGLGLSMVYELAKKMEAGLAVESIVGRGSVFTLILPARQSSNPMTKPE